MIIPMETASKVPLGHMARGLFVAGVIAGMHYLLWGKAFTEATTGEREELEAQERAEQDEGWLDETRRPRHY